MERYKGRQTMLNGAIIGFIATILGVIITYLLTNQRDNKKNMDETQKILDVINNEIKENFWAVYKTEKTFYDSIRLISITIINTRIGSLKIPIPQLLQILEIYDLFERINSRKHELREVKIDSNGLPKCSDLNELCTRCRSLIDDYQKKYDKKNRFIKNNPEID